MTRATVLGAWYGDHLPSGAFAAAIPNVGLMTHAGLVAWPEGEPWGIGYPRCTDIGGFRVAGQAHSTLDPACWEYDARWVPYAPPCVGVSPTIYDRLGVLHRSDGSVGSQGYRYVTDANVIVSGDASYGPFHGLFEYTDVGGLWIGQAAYDGGGVQVWDGAHLRQLELGDCRFVRANRDGETVALAFTKPDGVVLMLTTMAELRALPVVVPPEPQPEPPDPTPEPPDPEPEPPQPEPAPEPHYPPVEESAMSTPRRVALLGPGGKYGRPDAPNTGPWGHLGTGWRGLLWDGDTPDGPAYQFEETKPDDRFALRSLATDGWFGADNTKFSGSIATQFYVTPDGQSRGAYESPVIYDGALNGAQLGVVEYTQASGGFDGFSCAFAVVALP